MQSPMCSVTKVRHHSNRHYFQHRYYALVIVFFLDLIITIVSANGGSNLRTWEMSSNNTIVIDGRNTPIGVILSPRFPNTAPIGTTAAVLLQISDNSQASYDTIRLTIIELNLQTANNCAGEVVNVYLINNNHILDPSKIVYAICGSKPLEPVLVMSKKIALEFASDEFARETLGGRARRFKIKFEFINSSRQLYNGCNEPNQFKCRNRKCISSELLCNKFDDCGDASDEDQLTPCHNAPTIPYRIDYECGRSQFELQINKPNVMGNLLQNRIVGGSRVRAAHDMRLPQVSIQLIGIEPVSHICGGVLIHPLFVLTSAHCFQNSMSPFSYKLLFGLRDLSSALDDSSESYHQLRYASSISVYPNLGYTDEQDFAESNLDKANKLSIVELNAPVNLNSHVWPACLPHIGETIQANRECLNAGYGETRGSGHPFALKQTIQTIEAPSGCISRFGEFLLDDYSMICARNQANEGPCNGDSGGPLLCRDDSDNNPVNVSEPVERPVNARIDEPGELIRYLTIVDEQDKRVKNKPRVRGAQKYTVHGLTSFTTAGNMGGGFCGTDGVPIIYGRVSTRVDWILSVMKTALHRLNKADQAQDRNNQKTFFGYIFRTGQSQHVNFTRPMTID